MDNLVVTARYRNYLFKVTYSFGQDVLDVEWGDIQAQPDAQFRLPHARRRLLRCLQGSVSVVKKAIIITTSVIRNHLGVPILPIGPHCVLYQATLREDDGERFQKLVETRKLEEFLKGEFSDIESYLKEILGEEFDDLEASIVEELKSVRVTSVEMCEEEEAEKVLDELTGSSDSISQPLLDVVTKVVGDLDGKRKQDLQSKFGLLGITKTKHLRYLEEKDVASHLSGILKPMEIRDLAVLASGKERPLPPGNLRVSTSGYPNTALTVFFDDPNGMVCDYIVAARDVYSKEEISFESDVNFGVLEKLRPGKKYVVYAQCVNEDQKSKKTFFNEPINVFGPGRDKDEETDVDLTKQSKGLKKVVNISDSGISSAEDTRFVATSIPFEEDAFSGQSTDQKITGRNPPAGKSQLSFAPDVRGKEALETDATKTGSLWDSAIRREFTRVFPDMPDPKMEILLRKCEDIGLENKADLDYLKEEEVARELSGTLKIVELKKLLKHIKERSERPEGITFGGGFQTDSQIEHSNPIYLSGSIYDPYMAPGRIKN